MVRLDSLMARTEGREEVAVALLDGPVSTTHPALTGTRVRPLVGPSDGGADKTSAACRHGTFVAGLLSSSRDSAIPGICPGCPLLVRVIYGENGGDALPSATPRELAEAITESVHAGARIVNVSGAIPSSMIISERDLNDVLDEMSRRGVLVIAAAGNDASIGRTTITGHPSVLTIVPFKRNGLPVAYTNLGHSIARYGLGAPGADVTSINSGGGYATLTGSSFAAPFVTGAAALLWSLVPTATAAQIKVALRQCGGPRRKSILPPLLNAQAAYEVLLRDQERRRADARNGQPAAFGKRPATTPSAPSTVYQ